MNFFLQTQGLCFILMHFCILMCLQLKSIYFIDLLIWEAELVRQRVREIWISHCRFTSQMAAASGPGWSHEAGTVSSSAVWAVGTKSLCTHLLPPVTSAGSSLEVELGFSPRHSDLESQCPEWQFHPLRCNAIPSNFFDCNSVEIFWQHISIYAHRKRKSKFHKMVPFLVTFTSKVLFPLS